MDLKGLDPSLCTHRIFLEDESRPIRILHFNCNLDFSLNFNCNLDFSLNYVRKEICSDFHSSTLKSL